jgi:hypothetical protein
LQTQSIPQRIGLVKRICSHLQNEVKDYERVPGLEHYQLNGHAKKATRRTAEPEVHLTPPELALSIAKYAISLRESIGADIDFGDPAVGTGAFYAALLQVVPRARIASAIGIDISEAQVRASRLRWAHRGMDVMLGDYLHMDRLPRRNLILANPPYLRHQEIDQRAKERLSYRASQNVGLKIDAKSGQYVYFMILSHQWMSPGAVAAWLVPSEFMQTAYGHAIRHYLTHQVQLLRIHQFGSDERQFEDAKVLPAVVVFKNRHPEPQDVVRLTAGGTLERPRLSEEVSVNELRRANRWSIPWQNGATDAGSVWKIMDLFLVRRGIATGANEFFVFPRSEASRLGIPKCALRPLLPKARLLQSDIVEREDDGYPRVNPQLCLLDSDLSEEQIGRRFPKLLQYLESAKSLGILERNLISRRHPWYKQEPRKPAPFLCTYMGRPRPDEPPLRFIWNKSDAVVTNTYLMLYPRPALAKLLANDAEIAPKLFELLRETSRTTMLGFLRVHAGGLRKIEPKDLTRVLLPRQPAWLRTAIEMGIDFGAVEK